ncbi:MAG: RNA polymerase sporulation sigma factor SigF [Clostridium sp.]|jgi:RNA polymerase sporulation-specific sigma factor|uniref:RNA polymerase sporulation sigma factor SigF n=1 Tax=Clostridium sp. TaxID=1506 RepID=UPI0025B967FC|nr:RNA polymerase sporulation sigma factor SigF [Clostridium sp.]MCH3962871.1 RNA polymerase sporulation sigma factor SigF [Clostridium sp.]MCI1715714.1 RNA polymerase sporulation sigma factor SigF [Clostridium sp.]MCI1800081.1 RNA polymerase sporulation sigma factor SigF [Clostridium sp.]MCI1813995.1 RNA polymerase sporulation sigma factor SigF [Clostridium sp.]MCI1870893.1 RNA polymerase sporulation sigma factor SigF [Clostridium sp.]
MSEEAVKISDYDYNDNLKLIKSARKGDKNSLNKLVEVNLPLVTAISKKFLNRGYEYEDIFQIGCMGLMKAINNFDEKYNVKFSTYAVPMIMGEIKRFLRDDGMIKVSRSVKNTAKKLHYDKEKLIKKLNREPTVEELSEYSGIEVEDLIFASESANNMQYLYDTIHQDDGAPVLLIDKLSENPNEDVEMVDRIALKETLKNLDVKSRQIIMLRYFKDKTQVQVAKMLGINQVQVSRIEKRVLKTMRDILKE